MPTVKTKDGTEIFYKDWGTGQPIMFHHGWPLSSDDWDAQLLFFLAHGYRVVAHDRRGHGRSMQSGIGNDMDTYAADAAAVVEALDLQNVIHVGHSTGGGEALRYTINHGKGRVAKLAMLASVPPVMLKSATNPKGTPMEVFDSIRAGVAGNRSQFYKDLTMPFYGYNRPGAKISEGIRENWWRQGMMGGAQAHYEGVRVFSETDFTEDLKALDVPTLVMQGDDDQIVPIADAGLLQAELVKGAVLHVYPGLPHGLMTTEPERINADLLAFIKG